MNTNPTIEKQGTAVGVGSDRLFGLVLGLVRFPYAQICRHQMALDLLSLLEESGAYIPKELVKAVSDASNGDEEAERVLLQLLPNNPVRNAGEKKDNHET